MSEKPISELRHRMLEDMAVRTFGEATCRNRVQHIAEFAKFLGHCLSAENVAFETRQDGFAG